MRFNTKDLLVTVLPKADTSAQAQACLLHTGICVSPTLCISPSVCSPTFCHVPSLCHAPTVCHTPSLCGLCSVQITCAVCSFQGTYGCGFGNSCGAGGSACDPTVFCAGGSQDPWVIRDPEELAKIRQELKDTVAQLDALEKAGLPGSIQTREQADAVEKGLTEALEQVRAQKKNLK